MVAHENWKMKKNFINTENFVKRKKGKPKYSWSTNYKDQKTTNKNNWNPIWSLANQTKIYERWTSNEAGIQSLQKT